MQRAPMKRRSKPMRRVAFRPSRGKPARKRHQDEQFRKNAPEVRGGECAMLGVKPRSRVPDALLAACQLVATDAHHLVKRSQGGGHGLANLIGLCHPCHMWLHDHPEVARNLGMQKRPDRRFA